MGVAQRQHPQVFADPAQRADLGLRDVLEMVDPHRREVEHHPGDEEEDAELRPDLLEGARDPVEPATRIGSSGGAAIHPSTRAATA